MKGPREKLLYFPCIPADPSKKNYLCTVDADPDSESYGQVGRYMFDVIRIDVLFRISLFPRNFVRHQ